METNYMTRKAWDALNKKLHHPKKSIISKIKVFPLGNLSYSTCTFYGPIFIEIRDPHVRPLWTLSKRIEKRSVKLKISVQVVRVIRNRMTPYSLISDHYLYSYH